MTDEELRIRDDLATLARSDRGRDLLQLSLRGIGESDRGLTAGCWTDRGIAGCLFQHAYWQGVREGVFADRGRPGDWIGGFVGSGDYGIVIRTIDSFDRLAKAKHADVTRRLRASLTSDYSVMSLVGPASGISSTGAAPAQALRQ